MSTPININTKQKQAVKQKAVLPITTPIFLTFTFAILNWAGVIAWPWWAILAPVGIWLALFAVFFIAFIAIAGAIAAVAAGNRRG